jgi:exopolysaccharide biosynthesis protein
MLLVKLTQISFTAGKYKAVAIMNGKYFEMLSKCGKCLL